MSERPTMEDLEEKVKRALRDAGEDELHRIDLLARAMRSIYLKGMRDGRDDVRVFLAAKDQNAPDHVPARFVRRNAIPGVRPAVGDSCRCGFDTGTCPVHETNA